MAQHLQHPDPSVERDRDDIARPHRPAWRVDPRPIQPDMAGACERGRG
jgi:hypothetical protein